LITLFLILLFSSLASFIGSLQLGPVNLLVINTVLYRSRQEAFWIALGGSLPEFIYCGLAVYANQLLEEYLVVQFVFRLLFILVLLAIGFSFLFKKVSSIEPLLTQQEKTKSTSQLVAKGFLLAALNPQLLPFWIFVQVYFNTINFLQIQSVGHQISFILGSGLGAFALLLTFIRLVSVYKTKLLRYASSKYYFRVLAFLFFAIAIHQLVAFIEFSRT
jgi:threonine/homoserine/homoserine lactone efflux protein